jgi:hypothetical protein
MPSLRRLAALLTVACAVLLPARARAQGIPIHSAMTPTVVARLASVLASSGGARDAFVKIGDSNTANPAFLSCLAGADVRLGDHADLEETRRFFGERRVDGLHTSFDRRSTSATIGWLAGAVLAGSPAPLVREVAAVKPAFAVVMLGTNDDRVNGFDVFARDFPVVVDRLLEAGVIPLLSTIPPRADSFAAAARVPELNRVIREVAESRQVPLMDLFSALLPLPRHGLGGDGIHLSTLWRGRAPHACWMTPDGLQKGMNVRNEVVLGALDRARRFLIEGEEPETEPAPST